MTLETEKNPKYYTITNMSLITITNWRHEKMPFTENTKGIILVKAFWEENIK